EAAVKIQRIHVVVVGGGYAGTLAANRLRQRPDIDITLVNPRPFFVERIRLHQLAAGTRAATVEYDTLLGAGIGLVVDNVDRIDPAARQIQLATGTRLDYDYLIYAVGSTGAQPQIDAAGSTGARPQIDAAGSTGARPQTVPGAAEFAHSVADLESAKRLRYALADLPIHPSGNVPIVVVGAGLTGIETASELAERGRPVTLVCGG